MSIQFPELTEAEGALNLKRKQLHDIFDDAGPTMDMAKVKSLSGTNEEIVEQVRTLNTEIDELAKKAEGLRTILKGAENGAEYDENPNTETGDGSTTTKGHKSIGDLVAGDQRRFNKGQSFEVDVDLKATLLTSSGWTPQAVRTDRLVGFATRPPTVLDYIPTVTTNQISVVFMEETTFTNAAVEITEGAAKPQATLVYTERTNTARKIAVFLPVSDEQLEDVDRMRSIIDNRLSLMVRQRLASQILVGDGIAPNIKGLLNTSGINTQAKGADPTPDSVYKAMVLCMTVGFATPDLAIFNALDWQDVKLLRTADGLYIWGNPSEMGPDRIWGLPVVIEQGLTQNTAIVGAFGEYAELDIKKGLTVEVGYNNDDWTKNLQTIRAEMRATVVYYRPSAFAQITGV